MDEVYLRQRIGSVEQLADFEPEEVGAIIVAAIRRGQGHMLTVQHVSGALVGDFQNDVPGFPRNQRAQIDRLIFEAWSWLEAQGLLIWSDAANGRNGFRVLSRRGERLEIEDFSDFRAATLLPREVIHDAIRNRVWSDFIRGHYDSAVFFAARQVEIAVRLASGAEDRSIGVPLMRSAFHPENGLLADPDATFAEREARMHLFAGFIGSYKNPVSHRDVDIEDPHEAIEIILLASHLLRIVDARAP